MVQRVEEQMEVLDTQLVDKINNKQRTRGFCGSAFCTLTSHTDITVLLGSSTSSFNGLSFVPRWSSIFYCPSPLEIEALCNLLGVQQQTLDLLRRPGLQWTYNFWLDLSMELVRTARAGGAFSVVFFKARSAHDMACVLRLKFCYASKIGLKETNGSQCFS